MIASLARRLIRLDSHEIVARAIRRSKLEEFDGMDFAEPLEILCRSLDRDARLHPRGRLATRRRLVDLFTLRALCAHDASRRRVAAPSSPPIVLTGLPHSASSLLCQWLTQAPGLHPAPDSELLTASLASLDIELDWHVPPFAEWLDSADLTAAYHRLARTLRVMGADQPDRRWVLHGWQHLERLESLFIAFPDAVIVTVRRDLDDGLDPWLTAACERRSQFSDHVEAEKVKRYWRWRLASLQERGETQRATLERSLATARFIDVSHEELLAHPADTSASVLAACGHTDA